MANIILPPHRRRLDAIHLDRLVAPLCIATEWSRLGEECLPALWDTLPSPGRPCSRHEERCHQSLTRYGGQLKEVHRCFRQLRVGLSQPEQGPVSSFSRDDVTAWSRHGPRRSGGGTAPELKR
jgi:hypothetical protein